MSVSDDDARIGSLALEAGLVTDADINDALLEQEFRNQQGTDVLLGELMVELGLITRRQRDRLISLQATVQAKVRRVGPYTLIAKLGEGGMGAVYQARDRRTGALVALKILPRSKAREPSFLARFEQEARSVFELDHPNIVKVHGLGEADGYHYIAMQYIDGRDIYAILEEKGRIPEVEALSLAMQITQALEHASERGLVHRDIKPGNIIADRHGFAMLTDFGLALNRERIGQSRITGGGGAIGTPFYLSPEQARGEQEIDVRSDIYALGATLYEMVTGSPPFEGSPAVVMAKHMNEQIASPMDIDRTLSPGICAVIQKMMAKRREDRYQTPRELFKDILLVHQGRDPVGARIQPDRSTVRASLRASHRRSGPTAGFSTAEVKRRLQKRHDEETRSRESAETADPRPLWRRLIDSSNPAAFAAVAVVTLIASLFGARMAGCGGKPQPQRGELIMLSSFESATSEGWSGAVEPGAAADGQYFLRAPYIDAPGRCIETERLLPPVGSPMTISFDYYLSGPGPIVVEIADRVVGRRRAVIERPGSEEWSAASLSWLDFAPSAEARQAPADATAVRIIAPDCGAYETFALDSIEIRRH